MSKEKVKDHPTISSDICLIKKKIAEQIVYLNNYKQMSFTIYVTSRY